MKSSNLFWGLFFIFAAIIIVVSQLGYLVGINAFNLVMSVFLVAIIFKSIPKLNFFGIFFPMGILGMLFADSLNISSLVPYPILAVALFLSIGFSIMFKKEKSFVHYVNCSSDQKFDEVINENDEDIVNYNVNMGSGIKYINSKNLKTANLSCKFGELKAYFNDTNVSSEGARINLNVSFSGVELYIPKEWNLKVGLETNLSGVEEKNNILGKKEKTVELIGNVTLSGVEIIYI